ncbi:MAG: hypothetical protein CEN92_157 [Candidatus Berkelbacteria bacterium Licking1014_96]|uniref:Uncharacterized protein n=1 Tax=Candidatus Berkelbacteria bacterium Licking1014_96 TaxID=2017149 RepID=A0A554LHB7_9BACT|nr:MAG: hypothetical protein CEN92_157 [Candidatus Berkelbacteria bacterium Licking1014_96]
MAVIEPHECLRTPTIPQTHLGPPPLAASARGLSRRLHLGSSPQAILSQRSAGTRQDNIVPGEAGRFTYPAREFTGSLELVVGCASG